MILNSSSWPQFMFFPWNVSLIGLKEKILIGLKEKNAISLFEVADMVKGNSKKQKNKAKKTNSNEKIIRK